MINSEFETDFLISEGNGVNDLYKDTLSGIIESGVPVVSRELATREVRPVMIILLNPRERFLTSPGRRIHPYFQVLEAVWILGGRGDVEFISYYLENMVKYSDGGKNYHGAYGDRMRRHGWNELWSFHIQIRDQFFDCYHYLKKDPDTRHAVMTFWNPLFDNYMVETKDRPCNVAMHFLIRDGRLDLTIFNRSNDVNWGLFNTNVVQFSVILETMAMLLNIPVGKQIHMIDSLHLYDNQNELTDRVLKADYEFNVYDHVKPLPFKFNLPDDDIEKIKIFNKECDFFFHMEDVTRRNGPVFYDPEFEFSFLFDAITLSRSFYYYKKEIYEMAIDELMILDSLDIFISCSEFLSRKAEFSMIKERVVNKLKDKVSNLYLEKILEYVEKH